MNTFLSTSMSHIQKNYLSFIHNSDMTGNPVFLFAVSGNPNERL